MLKMPFGQAISIAENMRLESENRQVNVLTLYAKVLTQSEIAERLGVQ